MGVSSPTAGVMKEQVSDYLYKLMEERVHGHGLDLHELAVYAATLDDLILGEVRSAIAHIYEMLNMSMSGHDATAAEEDAVLGRFLVAYISGYHEEEGHPYESNKKELEDIFSRGQVCRCLRRISSALSRCSGSIASPFRLGRR